jgi:hypothetical protein
MCAAEPCCVVLCCAVLCCREREVFTSLELIKMLLREASGEDEPLSDPKEYSEWLRVLLEAEDPSQVGPNVFVVTHGRPAGVGALICHI